MMVITFILSSLFVATSAQDVKEHLVGDSVTLTCTSDVNDAYPIEWYFVNQSLYLSLDENIYFSVPNAIRSRISVKCLRFTSRNDVCNLTIASLIESDGGTYRCQYYDEYYELHYYFDSVQFNVSYGNLPSDESPICETFNSSQLAKMKKSIPDMSLP